MKLVRVFFILAAVIHICQTEHAVKMRNTYMMFDIHEQRRNNEIIHDQSNYVFRVTLAVQGCLLFWLSHPLICSIIIISWRITVCSLIYIKIYVDVIQGCFISHTQSCHYPCQIRRWSRHRHHKLHFIFYRCFLIFISILLLQRCVRRLN